MGKYLSFQIPQTKIDLNNNKPYLVGFLEVQAIARLFNDGSLRTIDIDIVFWVNGNNLDQTDVTTYINLCQPDVWEQIEAAALNNYQNVTSQKGSNSDSDHQ